MSETERFLTLSPQEQEEAFRFSVRKLFLKNPELIEVNKGLFSDEQGVTRARAHFIKETLERCDHAPIEI